MTMTRLRREDGLTDDGEKYGRLRAILQDLFDAPCPCGEPTPRMTRVPGRSDDMLILKK